MSLGRRSQHCVHARGSVFWDCAFINLSLSAVLHPVSLSAYTISASRSPPLSREVYQLFCAPRYYTYIQRPNALTYARQQNTTTERTDIFSSWRSTVKSGASWRTGWRTRPASRAAWESRSESGTCTTWTRPSRGESGPWMRCIDACHALFLFFSPCCFFSDSFFGFQHSFFFPRLGRVFRGWIELPVQNCSRHVQRAFGYPSYCCGVWSTKRGGLCFDGCSRLLWVRRRRFPVDGEIRGAVVETPVIPTARSEGKHSGQNRCEQARAKLVLGQIRRKSGRD